LADGRGMQARRDGRRANSKQWKWMCGKGAIVT
jgi:hypothetical protein